MLVDRYKYLDLMPCTDVELKLMGHPVCTRACCIKCFVSVLPSRNCKCIGGVFWVGLVSTSKALAPPNTTSKDN